MTFECKNSKHTLYGFTVKDNRQDVTDYDSFFDRCNKFKCDVQEYYGELDSKGRLHFHGIISIPKGFYRKKLCMPGLHLDLEEIYDLKGWVKYIKKDLKNRMLSGNVHEELTPPTSPINLKRKLFTVVAE